MGAFGGGTPPGGGGPGRRQPAVVGGCAGGDTPSPAWGDGDYAPPRSAGGLRRGEARGVGRFPGDLRVQAAHPPGYRRKGKRSSEGRLQARGRRLLAPGDRAGAGGNRASVRRGVKAVGAAPVSPRGGARGNGAGAPPRPPWTPP